MHASLAVHVGDWLKTEILEPYNIKVNTVAEHFGVSRQSISALLNGRSNLSADMAIRFEKAFGVRADTLMRMQSAFELAQARTHEANLNVQHFNLVAPSSTEQRTI
ncbi:HigA family addiction module antidote protein [Gluconobacter cerinus]|nr:HigA family addiction module antidote protein [Gluconobacter cerinus]MBS1036014.1 HigA family addiction module antidote protein [Gluconobacter cerinus]MBS1042093.1 HigA family addiction module antidote protein [Gluconobacter cerinus]MBS1048688.1 HigA family addiction module antidote protein [Gluconobacter cerinus]MBS1069499.1 HigA family addiction module antidote protein [Gluconobacter cerinus]